MLQISHLYANYGGKPALEDINLTLESGELLVVLGPSGCGKNHPAESDCRFCALSAWQHSTGG
ncbi:taurine ABC transporter ATP-binding protein [Escherichia coli]|uniref:Taurine ABC transporter ATP-binding protein n=1 Tax=Escherichia coli TaxID=562 RepID=A0A377AYA4_ECOLX|nr:taurine ABC transporter ATP-binding protein [Escherichia coli]